MSIILTIGTEGKTTEKTYGHIRKNSRRTSNNCKTFKLSSWIILQVNCGASPVTDYRMNTSTIWDLFFLFWTYCTSQRQHHIARVNIAITYRKNVSLAKISSTISSLRKLKNGTIWLASAFFCQFVTFLTKKVSNTKIL